MRSTILRSFLFIFCVITIFFSTHLPADSKTFIAYSYQSEAILPATFHSIHSDQKSLVDIDVNSLFNRDINELFMETFEGRQLSFKRAHPDKTYGENYLLKGYTTLPGKGAVTFVYNHQTITGNIVFSDHILKIRPLSERGHVLYRVEKAAEKGTITPFFADANPEEARVLELVNEERDDQGLRPLAFDENLHTAARLHSEDMGANNYFDHKSQDGRTPWDRIEDAGYDGNALGENIAAGQNTPLDVVLNWMNSLGHRENILNPTFCDLGVGYAFVSGSLSQRYWTQDFGRKSGINQCPSSPPDPDPDPIPDSNYSSDSGCFIQSLH